ncbi:MAG TPA: LacI family DNA-binding transcriptional regulator [Caldilineaceae bacterium]|nr:LacI family DNA-binding transcriptional regulator [Caldilineaceae bacterium]
MAPTMDDVARQAGVSKSTVSLALNDKPGISAELKQNILQAASELGYRLDKSRALGRPAVQRTIAVVHSQPDDLSNRNPEPTGLFLHYLNGIRAFAQTANQNLTVIADYSEGDTQGLAFHLLHHEERAFDGFILMGWSARQENRFVQQLVHNGIPAVALSRTWPETPISTVGPNYRQQVRLAIAHLTGLGHRQIAFVGRSDGVRFDWHHLRLDSYRAAMRQLTGQVDDGLVVLGETGVDAVHKLLQQRPEITAIFAVNDDVAIEVIQGLHELGLNAPQDFSVLGQDDMVSFLQPDLGLTTVGFSHFGVGYLAASLLHQQFETEYLSYGNLWVRSYLVERTSCGTPRRNPALCLKTRVSSSR